MPTRDPAGYSAPGHSGEVCQELPSTREELLAENASLRSALRISEDRYRTLLSSGTGAVFRTSGAGDRMLEVSGAFLESPIRESGGSAAGDWIAQNIHPEDRAQTMMIWNEAVRSQQPYHNVHRMLSPEGIMRYAICRAVPILDDQGAVREWIGTISDITEQRHAEEALRVSEERLRLILENAREYAIITMALDRSVTSWNTGAEIILGYSEDDILNELADIIFTPEDRAADVPAREAATALSQGRALDERWHLRKDGSRFWASGVMTPMRDSTGEAIGLLKIMRDQTAQLRSQEALEASSRELVAALAEMEHARAEAEAAGRAKDQFLAILSHELRTPLTPVLMAVRMLGREKTLSSTARDALEMIQRNVQLEARFVDDLLDVTRITRGKMEVAKHPMDMHDAILHAVEISREDFEARRQVLTIALDAEVHQLSGDSERLQQVVWNLLKNASKFTPDEGSIQLRSRNCNETLIVEVQDSGVGFEPGADERIFRAFEQANSDVARKFGGLGLGLAIAKATVDAHGGVIRAISEGPHRGATFIVELPLYAPDGDFGADSGENPNLRN